MFEGKPPFPPLANGQASGDRAEEDLDTITWPDLVAKLNAVRDLQREFASEETSPVASFDALSAHRLSSQATPPEPTCKRVVNPDDLANGKGTRCNGGGHTDGDDIADRGNT